jgi:hypothetical protein
MESYSEFPISTLIYNGVTLGGSLAIGAVVLTQYGIGVAVAYLLLLALAVVSVLGTVCVRCAYYGSCCALGLGKVVPILFKKGRESEFFRTAAQFVAALSLALVVLVPLAGSAALLIGGFSVWRLVQLVAVVGVFLAGLMPHTRLVCRHCRQGECGVCPVGRRVSKAG